MQRLRAASDGEIGAAFGELEARERGVRAVLAALTGTGWDGPAGTVRFVVALESGARESWTVRFATTGVSSVPGADPDVELRLGLVDVVRLMTGEADGALLHLAGGLEVVGDENLVLALGCHLRTADTGRPLIDPAALDPVAVSRAIAGARTEHLSSVMAGGFRSLVLSEVFGRLPEFLIEEKAAGVRVAIAFAIGGRRDGGTDRYVVRILDGVCTVEVDPAGETAVDATLVLEGHEFLRLVLGHLNPVRGVLSGQLRVEGQVIKALGFNSVMRIPGS
ncbi:SCP2 sterol-binding domain-containing protein [Nocardioides marmoriginsengisoli]|uniref:SCP2 sterol-binding domain-containing protein n=1 Tax=Nocardioides marmoriginsengisoli TaxID=661483 RepID=UPI00161DBCC1|nr:SCP2 sterol-binding domain-containing protein [Nocardioides marmoriginsengisoli]